jgi:hypothetical protein
LVEAEEMGFEDPLEGYREGRLLLVCGECFEEEVGAEPIE